MAKFTLNLDGPLLKIPNSIAGAGFDYVGRYQLMGEIIKRYGDAKGWPKNILDVGGLGSFLGQVIPTPITIFDSEAQEDGEETKGDGARMTAIKDGQYDAVITSDTLEHIPPKDRKSFVSELIRVSNDLVILCAPFADHGAAKEEDRLQDFHKGFAGKPHRWLYEHADFGLPREKDVLSVFKANGLTPAVINQSRIEIWEAMLATTLLANDMGNADVQNKAALVNRFYNRHLLFKDFSPNSYRTFFVASKKTDLTFVTPDAEPTTEDMKDFANKLNDFYAEVVKHAQNIPLVRQKIESQANELAKTQAEHTELKRQYEHIIHSKTWRYSEPLRKAVRQTRRRS